MRKTLAAMVAVLFCCSAIFAQHTKQKMTLGFKAGANLTTFRTAVEYSDFIPHFKLGQVFGAFVQVPVSSHFIVQPEFLYSQMGAKAESAMWDDVTFRYNYFSVPILVKYKIGSCFNVFAGPQFDLLIRARQKQVTKTSTITYGIKDFDFVYTAGIGVSGTTWTFDLRYMHGSQDVSPAAGETTFFNQGVQATLGYKLHKKAKKPKTTN